MTRVDAGTVDMKSTGPRWTRVDVVAGLGLLGSFLLSRILWIVYAPLSAFYWEEAWRWIVVREWIRDAPLSLADLQADHYQGGSLVVVMLARAMASFSGDGILTLKLTAIGLSSVTLVLLFVIGRRFFGRPVGVLAAALYVCGPPLVAYWGVCLMGFHAEATLPGLLLVYATLSLQTGSWRGRLAWSLAGAIATLALWFTPTAGIAVAACAAAYGLDRGWPSRRDIPALLSGALVGALPWLAYNANRSWVGAERLVELFTSTQSNDVFRTQGLFERSLDLIVRVPGEGLVDPAGVLADTVAWPVLAVGILVPAVAAGLAGVWRQIDGCRRDGRVPTGTADSQVRLERVFWLYALFFVVAYLASRFTLELAPRPIAFRLFAAPSVFLMLPLALSASRGLARGGRARAWTAAATGVGLLSLSLATGSLAVDFHAEGAPPEESLGYVVLGRLTQRKIPEPLGRASANVHRVEAGPRREWALRGVGWGISEYFEQGGSLDALAAYVESLPDDDPVRRGMRWAVDARLDSLGALHDSLEAHGPRDALPDLIRSIDRMQTMQRMLYEEARDAKDASDASRPDGQPAGSATDARRSTRTPTVR